MTAPTVTVTIDVASFTGVAREGARIAAKLDKDDRTGDVIIPAGTTRTETAASGIGTLELFPNALTDDDPPGLGTTGSSYEFTISYAGDKTVKVTAVVPDQDCNLADIIIEDDSEVTQPRTLSGAVRYDVSQSIADADMAIARANIEAAWYATAVTTFDATSLPDGASVTFAGRAAANDGGGGTFTYSAASTQTADDMMVFAPTGGGRLFRQGWTVLGFNGPADGAWAGVKPDGTDQSVALRLAWTAVTAFGQPHLHLSRGTYVIDAATTSYDFVSNMTFSGDGLGQTTIWWKNGVGAPYYLFGRAPLLARISNVCVRGIHFRGNHDSDYVQASFYPLLVYNTDGLRIENCKVSYSRVMGIVARGCFDVGVFGNTVEYCGRDGINTGDCDFVSIMGNTVQFVDDDAIACASFSSGIRDRGTLIVGNTIRFAQGIKALGLNTLTIQGNLIEFVMGQGISVYSVDYAAGWLEGTSSTIAVVISGNTVKNAIDRTIVDNLNQNAPYIYIGGLGEQAGTLDAIPGENIVATGAVINPYAYFNNAAAGVTTTPIPGNYNITVANNVLVRDVPSGILLSSLGLGSFYTRTGPIDPTLTLAALQQHGIQFASGIAKNVVLSGNSMMGLGQAIALGATTQIVNGVASNNVAFDCTSGLTVNGSNTKHHSFLLSGNVIDLDPFMLHANRGANGTWLANGSPTAFAIQNASGFVIARNVIRNCCRATDLAVDSDKAQFIGNIVECDPTSSSFNATNKGVGTLGRAGTEFLYKIVDCNPASATYGNTLNLCHEELASIPTSGKYVVGHFCRNRNATVLGSAASQYIVQGWLRMTTGSGHVLDTDWREMRTLTGT